MLCLWVCAYRSPGGSLPRCPVSGVKFVNQRHADYGVWPVRAFPGHNRRIWPFCAAGSPRGCKPQDSLLPSSNPEMCWNFIQYIIIRHMAKTGGGSCKPPLQGKDRAVTPRLTESHKSHSGIDAFIREERTALKAFLGNTDDHTWMYFFRFQASDWPTLVHKQWRNALNMKIICCPKFLFLCNCAILRVFCYMWQIKASKSETWRCRRGKILIQLCHLLLVIGYYNHVIYRTGPGRSKPF